MSSIQKISIQGIRSFGPDDNEKQLVHFYSPLTLILGPNGTGKTTIIECLKYLTTGDMPPNASKGGCFVHDPKLVHEVEVKGQVRMQFKDVAGKEIFVTRSLVATQKLKKIETRTLDGTIMRKDEQGNKRTLTSKCADINKEMITSLGVSRPILNNVIFCHQEDSSWPLGEGKAVKQKFDEIFAATRYIKALESIRKVRLDLNQGRVVYIEQVKNLQQNKEQADKIKKDLEDSEIRLMSSTDSIKKINDKMVPLEGKLETIRQREKEINKVATEIAQKETQMKEMGRTVAQLKIDIKTEFPGTTEQLRQAMQDFENDMQEKHENIKRWEVDMKKKQQKLDQLSGERTHKLREIGKLQTEAKQFADKKKTRDIHVNRVVGHYELTDLNFQGDKEFSSSQVDEAMRSLNEKLKTVTGEMKAMKIQQEQKEKELQNKIDGVRDSKAKLEQSIKLKSDDLIKNGNSLKQLESQLRKIDASAAKHTQIETELQQADKELQSVEESMDVNTARNEIEKLKKDLNREDSELRQLDTELQRMHLQSSTKAELDLARNEKITKSDFVRKTLEKHEDTLNHLLGRIPTENIRYDLEDFIRQLNDTIKTTTNESNSMKIRKSTADSKRQMLQTQLRSKEDELKGFEEKLRQACGSENFDSGLDILKKSISDLQEEKAVLVGTQYIYSKFVEKLKKANACCPVCRRDFDEQQDINDLIHDLQSKLRLVPNQVDANEKKLSSQQDRFNTMNQLRPLKSQMEALSQREIPSLRQEIKTLAEDVEKTTKQINDHEESLEAKQVDVSMASSIQSDIVATDQMQADLKKIEKKITTLSSKLFGGDMNRTIHQVNKEKEKKQDEVDNLKRTVDNKRERLSNHMDLVQQLRSKVNDLRAEELEVTSQLQSRQQLEDNRDALICATEEAKHFIKQEKEQLLPLDKKLTDLRKDKDSTTAAKEELLDDMKRLTDDIRDDYRKIQALHQEIQRYIQEGQQEALLESEKVLKELESVMQKHQQEKLAIAQKVEEGKEDLASCEIRKRELNDNLQLRKKQKEIENIDFHVKRLREDFADFDVVTLKRDRMKSEKDIDDLKSERSLAEGRKRELAMSINRLKEDLKSDLYNNAEQKHKEKWIELQTTEMAISDLKKYYDALDSAIMQFHMVKMEEINKIIRELWQSTYRGNDIDYIEIKTDHEDSSAGGLDKRRVYHYRVIMVKGDTIMDMRGRCSAGQKVLASLIIRMALAETFCINCGIFTLDEPTTNLDRDNIGSLAEALVQIIKSRQKQRNFQLVVITHDEDFIDMLGHSDYVDHYLRVGKNEMGNSVIKKCLIKTL